MEVGVVAHLAKKKRLADGTAAANGAAAARVKAQAQATRQKNLAKIGIHPDDPLMLVPEGPGPSREEMRNIRKEVAGQARKRKLGASEGSVSDFRSLRRRTN
jgi:hypothetical protein